MDEASYAADAFARARVAHSEGDLDAAEMAYREAAHAGHADAALELGLLYAYELDRGDDARRVFAEAIECGDRRAMFELGFYLWFADDAAGAEAAFQRAADAGDPHGHLQLGFVLADEGRQEEALRAFTHAAALGLEQGWTQLGWQLCRLARLEEAERALRRAARGGDPAAHSLIWQVLEDSGRADEVQAALDEANRRAAEVDLGYRDLVREEIGEDLDEDELEEWLEEEADPRDPRPLATLLHDSAAIAEAETRLALEAEHGDEEAAADLARLRAMTGRPPPRRSVEPGAQGGDPAG